MRDFIKENLRIQLEGLSSYRDTSRNIGPSSSKSLVRLNKDEMKTEIERAEKIYKKYPDFFGGAEHGEGLYEFVLYIKGGKLVLKPKENSVGVKRIPGVPSDIISGKQYYYMNANLPEDNNIKNDLKRFMAYNVGKNPEDYKLSRIDVAYIKVLTLNAEQILAFNGENSYTDADQLDINKELSIQRTNPEDMYRFKKLDKDKKNNPDFKPKNVTSVDFNPKIDTLKKDLANNIRFLNTAKNIKQDYINKKEPIDPKLEKRIEDLESKIEDLESELDNYGK